MAASCRLVVNRSYSLHIIDEDLDGMVTDLVVGRYNRVGGRVVALGDRLLEIERCKDVQSNRTALV